MYKLKLMFEWGGGAIWCANNEAIKKYDVGSIEQKLPLSKEILEELHYLSELHDEALNWEYPPAPSPWTKAQFESFESQALEILHKLRVELGSKYEIQYYAHFINFPLSVFKICI